jgi:hypothetical protein
LNDSRLTVSAARRCDFTGCTRAAKHEVLVRMWSSAEKLNGDELVFRFKKVACSHHMQNPGEVSGLIALDVLSQINWGLLSSGKKVRDVRTAEFAFAEIEIINPFGSKEMH